MTPRLTRLVKRLPRLRLRLRRRRGGRPKPPWRPFLAWCVHFYTALGLVCAAGVAVLLVRGSAEAYRWSFFLMLVATLIDATDGTLARAVRIKEVLPGFDGRRLDDLVDFLNYTALPLLLIWRAGLLPAGCEAWLLLPLLASAYGFCQVSVKTDDGFFLGFPSYWNIVAFYLYVLQPLPGAFSLAVVVVLALLTFVPSRYLYPTQGGRLNRLTNLLGAAWVGLLAAALWLLPPQPLSPSSPPDQPARLPALVSLYFPIYYMAASWVVTWRLWRRRRPVVSPPR
jgi:phosphatidylcholine synthase